MRSIARSSANGTNLLLAGAGSASAASAFLGGGGEEDEDETSIVKRHTAADYCSMEPAEKKMLLYYGCSTRA